MAPPSSPVHRDRQRTRGRVHRNISLSTISSPARAHAPNGGACLRSIPPRLRLPCVCGAAPYPHKPPLPPILRAPIRPLMESCFLATNEPTGLYAAPPHRAPRPHPTRWAAPARSVCASTLEPRWRRASRGYHLSCRTATSSHFFSLPHLCTTFALPAFSPTTARTSPTPEPTPFRSPYIQRTKRGRRPGARGRFPVAAEKEVENGGGNHSRAGAGAHRITDDGADGGWRTHLEEEMNVDIDIEGAQSPLVFFGPAHVSVYNTAAIGLSERLGHQLLTPHHRHLHYPRPPIPHKLRDLPHSHPPKRLAGPGVPSPSPTALQLTRAGWIRGRPLDSITIKFRQCLIPTRPASSNTARQNRMCKNDYLGRVNVSFRRLPHFVDSGLPMLYPVLL
ncbi:hypothetical protein K438DRAFT_1836654 [Mycena galopus ATCC 62051]|nr:hypothetical protein K438DRAFT_1836654 [Mycena galopus ATCC 62051]